MSDGKKQHENEDRRLAPLKTGAASAVGDTVIKGRRTGDGMTRPFKDWGHCVGEAVLIQLDEELGRWGDNNLKF